MLERQNKNTKKKKLNFFLKKEQERAKNFGQELQNFLTVT